MPWFTIVIKDQDHHDQRQSRNYHRLVIWNRRGDREAAGEQGHQARSRRADKLRQIVNEIEKDGGQAVFRELDVTNPSDNDDIVKLAKETFGRVDVIFLNAGIMPNSPISALKTSDLRLGGTTPMIDSWHGMLRLSLLHRLDGFVRC